MPRKSALTEAINGVAPAIKMLHALNARCMEQVTDDAGIVCERWILPNGRSVVVFGTPHWRNVFMPSEGDKWTDTERALVALSKDVLHVATPGGAP
jgi:hypothetical protein